MNLEPIRADEVFGFDRGAMKWQHRGDAFDAELLQRAAGATQDLIAVGTGDDQLRHQRVEYARHAGAADDTAIHANPGT
ncbi:hypothetical protein D3C71_763660 [compost metagenome]